MATISKKIDISRPVPQKVKNRVITGLSGRKIDLTDPDNPELTVAELREIAGQARAGKERIMFSLRLSKNTVKWWQNLGRGYTGLMTKLLEEAPGHPDWIKAAIEK
ncbi:MAG: hypothetical protein LBQ83_03240 [Candidatus Margulisbacteria bacterium]|jgi:hypothetical protein|nr:hypothetical protein [Candidatus Margulisiibacteriota bacterium]